ncbi:Ankyrin repeat domain-containing protein 50, partial [Durusdinium trenchii]
EEHMDEDLQCLQLGLFQVADGMALSNFFHDKPVAEALVMQEIGRVVPTKATGLILPSGDGGGTLQFIGRTIERRSGSPDLFVYVEPSYLDSTFESYGIKHSSSSTAAAPDLASHLEKTDASSLAELSDEVYGKFRRALGKLLWLGQTRMDMKVYLSLLGTKQAEPTFAAEQALRAVLRFLRNDGRVALRFPSPALMAENPDLDYVVHVFADASHAPYRFNGRKGISGQAVYVNHCLVCCERDSQLYFACQVSGIPYIGRKVIDLQDIFIRICE